MDFGIDAHKGFLRVSAIDERGVEVAAAQLATRLLAIADCWAGPED